ncbi:TPA: phage tail protein, partial [Escherichia coli]|nr:phage tail protein [Escherichia coli]
DSFEKFLARHEGYKSFFWRPPGINRKIRVVCRTWSATEHITYTDFSCQFDEVVI